MPKITAKNSTLARFDPTGQSERIVISDTHKFDWVARQKHRKHKDPVPLRARIFDPEIGQEALNDIRRKAVIGWLMHERTLLERISSPPPPLITRLEPRDTYEIPKPLPDIKFRKTKILLRTEEYNGLFAATADRLEPLFAKLEKDGGLDPITTNRMRKLADEIDDLYHNLEEKAHKLTNKHWRLIKRDLKKISHISFANLGDRFPEICSQLVSLDLTFKY